MAPKRSYDDLETDYLEEENESGFLSLVSVIIAFIAVAVFIALAWYAYQSNTSSSSSEEIEVVYPEEGPVREAPEESGGWQFPHQDKSVYNIVSGEKGEQEGEDAKVEQILPAPEQPVERPEVETKIWMNDKLKQEPIAQTDAERQMAAREEKGEEKTSEPSPATAAKPVEQELPAEAGSEKSEVIVEKAEKAPEQPAAAVTPSEEKEAEVKPEPAPATATVQEKKEEVAKPVAVASPPKPQPVATGNVAIQLGAVRSDADARAQWQRMRSRFSLLGNKSLNVQSADIPGKGTFYRIQAGGFASRAEAKAACDKLAAAGQACFVVGK